MREHDGMDDRQAQPEAAGAAVEALERLEQVLHVVRLDPRTAVRDREPYAASHGMGADVDPTAALVVADRVIEQVGDQPLEQLSLPARPRLTEVVANLHPIL